MKYRLYSHKENILKTGLYGDYLGEYFRCFAGDTKSLPESVNTKS